MATDDERAGVQFAERAPFYPRGVAVDPEDGQGPVFNNWADAPTEGPWVFSRWTGNSTQMMGRDTWGDVVREYEARTTREAVARLIAERKRAA